MRHEIILKPEARVRYQGKSRLYGFLSRFDFPKNEVLIILDGNRNGIYQNLGQDGTAISLDDIVAIFKEETDHPGVFEETNIVSQARRHYVQYGGQYADPTKSDLIA